MLPIEKIRPEMLAALSAPSCTILLSAPTGSGKSTRVPGMLHEAGWTSRGTVLVVQPRRLAARMLAGYVAQCWPCALGQDVGYAVRFDKRSSEATRILFVTDGVLERRLSDDPELKGISAIVFDEVHERRLSGDVCLARALQLQSGSRPDLGIVVMSATLELDKLQGYLPQAQLLRAHGRLYPVDISYRQSLPRRDRWGAVNTPPLWEQVTEAVKSLVEEGDQGDILVFLPGAYEINRAQEILSAVGWMRGRDVFPLHGQLAPDAQQAAVDQGLHPRVILSTNIAETSLTIQGVSAVVDSGCARESRWDPARGISTLHVQPISQAQAEQRAGRAGRLRPGKCVRLWSEAEHRRRAPFPAPEVLRADLSAAFMNLLSWGCVGLEGLRAFPWPDAPLEAEATRAWQLLEELGAVQESGRLTDVGRAMMRYPMPPVLARLMVAGVREGCEAEMAALAALLGGEAIAMKSGLSDKLLEPSDYSDFQAEWRALQAAIKLNYEPKACTALGIMGRAAREIAASYRQLLRRRAGQQPDFHAQRAAILRALLHSMPQHLAVLNSSATKSARLSGKRGGKVEASSVALSSSSGIFLAAEITEIGGKAVETRLSRCTEITEEDLAELDIKEIDSALYDPKRRRVINYRQRVLGDLMISETEAGTPDASCAAELLAEQIVKGKLMLNSWDGHVVQWINRLRCLREAMPELEMPEFAEEDRLVAITMLCEGASSYKQIENRALRPILADWLSPWQRDCLKKYAPKSIKLSNGREVKLLYREDGTPSFGLKCQLLFGVDATPTVAEGRVSCLVEILAPNQRPYQVTCDLPSFWRSGYNQMRKDLAGRYPKHDWSDRG